MVIIPYTCILENSKFYEDAVEVEVSDGISSGEGSVAGGGIAPASSFAPSGRSVAVEGCSPVAEVFSASSSSMISEETMLGAQ